MHRRWAFEAGMVTQFKEKTPLKIISTARTKTIADADYKRIYLYPPLESKLELYHLNYL